jgi:hypothetical protein
MTADLARAIEFAECMHSTALLLAERLTEMTGGDTSIQVINLGIRQVGTQFKAFCAAVKGPPSAFEGASA